MGDEFDWVVAELRADWARTVGSRIGAAVFGMESRGELPPVAESDDCAVIVAALIRAAGIRVAELVDTATDAAFDAYWDAARAAYPAGGVS